MAPPCEEAPLETYAFSADISQLMSLIINAFYSNKEIFIRELISNASDAMDKIRHQALQRPDTLALQPDLYIKVTPDREARTIVIEDAGIAMTRDELVNHLGTIAKSGTKAFFEACSAGADMTMIGQFGVGFYSAYLVSEKILVISKSADSEDQHIWESTANGTFSVKKDEDFEYGKMVRGTKVVCFLKDDCDEFLHSDRLQQLIVKHSCFVGYPITLYMEHRKEEAIPDSEEKNVVITHSWEHINKSQPVWLRPKQDVSHEEYADLYKLFSEDWQDHLAVNHVETGSGGVDFKALLFCPRCPPKDMFDMGKMAQRTNIRLYVRRVFIKEFYDMVPKWMGFIKGIVDSDDMPLNISREMLQQNQILKHIKTGLVKRTLEMFHKIAENKADYVIFYEAFSQCLKLGVYEDHANRHQIVPLLRYYSSKSGEDLVSFEDYCARMRPGQRHILYISGRSKRDCSKSPYIEGLKRDGYEILYMFDPADEYAVQFLKQYNGMDLMSCMNSGALRLLDANKSKAEMQASLEPLRRKLATLLASSVSRVTFGPAMDSCGQVLTGEDGLKVLELNPSHGLLGELCKCEDKELGQDLAFLVYELSSPAPEGTEDVVWRRSLVEKCQALLNRINVGDDDECRDDLPPLGVSVGAPPGEEKADDAMSGQKRPATSAGVGQFSCGSMVRVVKESGARRAIVSFHDEDDQTVDVMYHSKDGKEEEEDGLPIKSVQALLPFENSPEAREASKNLYSQSLFKGASATKEEGNQLFKLKDSEAATERYTMLIDAMAGVPRKQYQQVLAVDASGSDGSGPGPKSLKSTMIKSIDGRTGECELSDGSEVPASAMVPVHNELLPLQTAGYMNRARCRQTLGFQRESAQDLTMVIALWACADKRMMEADPEMKEAEAKGVCTAYYLRGRSRLNRGLVKAAAADVRDALARNPPAAISKQLRVLKGEVQAMQEQVRQVNGPLARELAKVVIMIRPNDETA